MSVIMLKKVRIAFPELFVPKSVNGGEARFGATFAIEPNSENAKLIRAEIAKVAKAKWKENADRVLEEIERKDRMTFSERELTNSEGKIVQGFADMYFLKAYNKTRPSVMDKDPRVALIPSDGKPYGGCYVNAVIDIWAQDGEFGKRINATLLGVQFSADGEAFGGGAPVSPDVFPDLSESSDEDNEFV